MKASNLVSSVNVAQNKGITVGMPYCRELTRTLRDICLDDDCNVCEDIDDEEESSSSEEDVGEEEVEETGPCRAKCSWLGKPGGAPLGAGAVGKESLVKHFISNYYVTIVGIPVQRDLLM